MFRLLTPIAAFLLITFSTSLTCFSQSIVSVEEDWELNVATPNASRSSPQLSIMMSPLADIDSIFATFLINARTEPNGLGGGLQVQLWNGSALLAAGDSSKDYSLGFTQEKIQWTQRMSISNQQVLTVEIVNGTSTTWGKFGGGNELVATTTVAFSDLNAYNPDVSAINSGVNYGNQRVKNLIIRKVRTYTNGGKKSVDRALDRVVFPTN